MSISAARPLNRRHRLLGAVGLGCLLAGGLLVVTPTAGADVDSDKNKTSYWEHAGYGSCEKNEHPWTPYVLPAPAAGWSWTLLVVKAGSGNSAHQTVVNPAPGSYVHSSGHRISHIIRCRKPVQVTTTTQATTTTEKKVDETTTTTEKKVDETTTTTEKKVDETTTTTEKKVDETTTTTQATTTVPETTTTTQATTTVPETTTTTTTQATTTVPETTTTTTVPETTTTTTEEGPDCWVVQGIDGPVGQCETTTTQAPTTTLPPTTTVAPTTTLSPTTTVKTEVKGSTVERSTTTVPTVAARSLAVTGAASTSTAAWALLLIGGGLLAHLFAELRRRR